MKKQLFFVAALLTGSYVQAQTDSSAKPLDEIIVTANRLEQKQSQTGKVVTVIGKDVLEKSAGKTVSQVLNEQAGIVINGALNNAGTVQTVFMRGGSSGRVLVLVDGIPAGDPSFINNEMDLNFFSLNDVERIEIARGAQSTLYGSDAVAGVINIITIKKQISKPVNLKATVIGGNKGTFRGNIQLYGKEKNLTYQARYSTINTNGFSSAYDKTGAGNFDNDGYHGHIANASVQYQANQQLSFRSFVQYSKYKSDVDLGTFRDDKDFTINNRIFTSGGGFQFKTDAVTVTGNYQYTENKRRFLNDSTDVTGFSKYESEDYFSKSQYTELYATIRLSKNFTLLQGADYRYGSYNSSYLSISSYGPYATKFRDTSVSQASMYSSLIYTGLQKKLNIELGGRLNVHSRYGSNYTYTFNPSYTVSKTVRAFGSIATGFKAPGLYQLYSDYGNANLKPEESINYEAGLQFSHTKAKLTHRLVYFYREIKNGIDFDYNYYVYFNFNKQFVRGLEYEAKVQLLPSVTVAGNYTYINGTEMTQSRITFTDTAYSYLLRRPAHSLNITINYQWKEKLNVSLSNRYVSKRNDVAGYQVPDEALKAYFLLNLYADYRFNSRVRFFADAQNITNTRFFDLRGFNSIPFLASAGVTVTL